MRRVLNVIAECEVVLVAVIETGLIVGYIIAWAVRKARRVAGPLDAEVDTALDAGLGKLHELVQAKLGPDPALSDLVEEAQSGDPVGELTRQRVELSIQATANKSEDFAQGVTELVASLQRIEKTTGRVAISSGQGSAVVGDADIRADHGSIAGSNVTIAGGAHLGGGVSEDPHLPDRPRG
jgi:methyl-accepting chemotaxis protein